MADRSVSVVGTSLALLLLASLAQATLFGNLTLGISSTLQKCSCQNIWSRIVTAFRNILGLQQPLATPITPSPSTPATTTPAPSVPVNKSAATVSNIVSNILVR